jgi:hypothetical protein
MKQLVVSDWPRNEMHLHSIHSFTTDSVVEAPSVNTTTASNSSDNDTSSNTPPLRERSNAPRDTECIANGNDEAQAGDVTQARRRGRMAQQHNNTEQDNHKQLTSSGGLNWVTPQRLRTVGRRCYRHAHLVLCFIVFMLCVDVGLID